MKFLSAAYLSFVAVTVGTLTSAACEKNDDPAKEGAPVQESDKGTATHDAVHPETSPATAPAQGAAEPGQIKSIMGELGADMGALQAGLWIEDFEMMEASALKIANHPKISPSEKERLKKTLGPDMAAFGAMDKVVHEGALRVAEFAKLRDLPKVVKELSTLQGNCVACHSQFRARLK